MALSVLGFLGRFLKPSLLASNAHPTDIGSQVRDYAARKGTRARKQKQRLQAKLRKAAKTAAVQKVVGTKTKVSSSIRRESVFTHLPDVPGNQHVFLSNEHKPKLYSLHEAVQCHRENHHPSILDNSNTPVNLVIELNMATEKSTRFVEPWKNVVVMPHNFLLGRKKMVLTLCEEDWIETAVKSGADKAGSSDLIQAIKDGNFNIKLYDVIIGQESMVKELTVIRAKLKPFVLKTTDDTLTSDIVRSIQRHKFGIPYQCLRGPTIKHFGWIETSVGTLDMDFEKLDENLRVLLRDVYVRKPKRDGDFVTWIWCSSPPSTEVFAIDPKPYIEKLSRVKREQEATKTKSEEATPKEEAR